MSSKVVNNCCIGMINSFNLNSSIAIGECMQPTVLRCPNCGATVSPPVTKCDYCGAHLTFQNNILSFSNTFECPGCKTSLAVGSFICVHCGNILVTDSETINIVKTQQKRIKFIQERLRNSIASARVLERLEPTEYIYHVSVGVTGLSLFGNKKFETVVTDKRIIVWEKGTFNDISYENIVTISRPILVDSGYSIYQVVIATYEGDRSFIFNDFSKASHFSNTAELAFNNHLFKRKNIETILCFANI